MGPCRMARQGAEKEKSFLHLKGFDRRSVQGVRKRKHETEVITHERTMKKKELSDRIWKKTSG
jgi:hypothetical protein